MSKIDKSRPALEVAGGVRQRDGFLMVEQYALAEDCFERVVKEFPDSHEAWVNLGNACLMRYFDKFDVDEIKCVGVGQVMTPGFICAPTRSRGRRRQALEKSSRRPDETWNSRRT